MNADHFQAIFWSLTYILLIIHSLHYKDHGIPLSAIVLNFAWETVALQNSIQSNHFSDSLLIHIAWFFLDLIMVILFLSYETKISENKSRKIIFLFAYIISTICFVFLFNRRYMLLSSFLIDLFMAIAFLLYLLFKYPNRNLLIYLVGFSKLLGDLCAWYYYRNNPFIHEIGTGVLICNLLYIMILATQDSPLSFLYAQSALKVSFSKLFKMSNQKQK